jgi:hypothetical protein
MCFRTRKKLLSGKSIDAKPSNMNKFHSESLSQFPSIKDVGMLPKLLRRPACVPLGRAATRSQLRFGLAAIFALIASRAFAAAPTVQFTGGYEASSGRYGETVSTELQSLSLSATARYDDFSLRYSLPWLFLHGPASVVVIGGTGGSATGTGGTGSSVGSSGGGGTATSRQGLGDSTMTFGYTARDIADTPLYAVFSLLVRIPTGDVAKGLGVGVVDFGLQTEVGGRFDSFGVYATIGHRFRGNRSGMHDRLDGWSLSAGGYDDISPDLQAGLFADWQRKIALGTQAQADAGVYVRYKIDSDVSLQAYALKGFTSGSPAILAGLRLGYTL